jgi:hypothetical protein
MHASPPLVARLPANAAASFRIRAAPATTIVASLAIVAHLAPTHACILADRRSSPRKRAGILPYLRSAGHDHRDIARDLRSLPR